MKPSSLHASSVISLSMPLAFVKMRSVTAFLLQATTGISAIALDSNMISPSVTMRNMMEGTKPGLKSTLHAPTATCTSASPGNDYMVIANKWRRNLSKGALVHDPKLESNARDTVMSSNGQMVHKLNTGTYAQVLAPAIAEDFEDAFVGGWLCERPSLPGLDGVCTALSRGWDYREQTGHADILTSAEYSKLGCGWHAGVWACDLA
jgi:hypothetical protein